MFINMWKYLKRSSIQKLLIYHIFFYSKICIAILIIGHHIVNKRAQLQNEKLCVREQFGLYRTNIVGWVNE